MRTDFASNTTVHCSAVVFSNFIIYEFLDFVPRLTERAGNLAPYTGTFIRLLFCIDTTKIYDTFK